MVAAVENLFDVAELLIKNGADARIVAQVRSFHVLFKQTCDSLQMTPERTSVVRTSIQHWCSTLSVLFWFILSDLLTVYYFIFACLMIFRHTVLKQGRDNAFTLASNGPTKELLRTSMAPKQIVKVMHWFTTDVTYVIWLRERLDSGVMIE